MGHELVPLHFPNHALISCVERNISEYVNQVPWLDFNENVCSIIGKEEPCPFTLSSEQVLFVSVRKGELYGFILE